MHDDGGRGERKLIGRPIPQFEVYLPASRSGWRQRYMGDEVAGFQHCLAMRRAPGQNMKIAKRDRARAPRPSTWMIASRAAMATHMSDGFVAIQWSLVPRMASVRLLPVMAGQPVPGSRLLQGIAVSRK